jgi:hypothetical protein
MTDRQRPSPLSFAMRGRGIPPRAGNPRPVHEVTVPARGWQDAYLFLDTGILVSAGLRRPYLKQFQDWFADRMVVAATVQMEIERLARPSQHRDARLSGAAGQAKIALMDTGLVQIERLAASDTSVVEEIREQLQAMADDVDTHQQNPFKHAGEAATIAIAQRWSQAGKRIIFATNDGGASRISRQRGVAAMNFPQILRQFVCNGEMMAIDALDLFTYTDSISGIPLASKPDSEGYFACSAVNEVCAKCGDAP